MPRKSISFELDFMTKDILPKFTVKQFDDVSFNIKPKKQGLDYDTTGMTGKIFIGVNNDMFMQTKNITVSNNNVNILLDRNMLQKNGRAYAEVELTDSNGTITSSSFIFNIDEKIGEGAKIPGEYEGFVAKYERLISEFKTQVNSTINNCNTQINSTINNCNASVDNKLNTVDSLINVKISDFEKRFNRLTSSQQQDAEVIDARTDFKGVVFDSLKERIDYTDKILRESTVSTVTTESDFTTVEATSNGYFEDVKLEGKTLVNLVDSNSFTEVANYSSIVIDVTKFKPSTTYTLKLFGNLTTVKYIYIGSHDDTEIVIPKSTTTFIKFITPSNINSFTKKISLILYNNGTDFTSEICKTFKALILEGDHTQNPPSYFEGLMSVGGDVDEIVVSSVKGDGNLFDINNGFINSSNAFVSHTALNNRLSVKITNSTGNGFVTYNLPDNHLVEGEVYTFSAISEDVSSDNVYTQIVDGEGKHYSANRNVPITFTKKGKMSIRLYGNLGSGVTRERVFYNITLTKGTTSQYTPHQADKKRLLFYNEETQTWEKPILREWDSIEKHADGKYYYHQRSREVVLNGSENWYLYSGVNLEQTLLFGLTLDGYLKELGNNTLLADKIKCNVEILDDVEGIFNKNTHINYNTIGFKILKSKLSTQDVQGFKQWLQANNVTVVYQLAQEKVYECTNIDLITYANETNYIVECGAISPKTTLKVHNNISNVVSLLQKKVSLLESNMTKYMITQNRMQLASTYSADSVTFKVDYFSLCGDEENYDEDLYNLILNNILVGKDNYDYDKMFTMILDYASWNQISWEQFDILVGLMDMQHNPPIEETPTDDEIVEEIPNEIM